MKQLIEIITLKKKPIDKIWMLFHNLHSSHFLKFRGYDVFPHEHIHCWKVIRLQVPAAMRTKKLDSLV